MVDFSTLKRALSKGGWKVLKGFAKAGELLKNKVVEGVKEFRESRDLGVKTYSRIDDIPDEPVRMSVAGRIDAVRQAVAKEVGNAGGSIAREKTVIQKAGGIYAIAYTAEAVLGKHLAEGKYDKIVRALKKAAAGEWSVDIATKGRKVRLLIRYAFTESVPGARPVITEEAKKKTKKKKRRRRRSSPDYYDPYGYYYLRRYGRTASQVPVGNN